MLQTTDGKLNPSDKRMAVLWTWLPWLSSLAISLPFPLFFVILYLVSVTTESAAIYLFLSFVSMGLGLVLGLSVLIFLLLYRKRWHARMRDRLAADGITAGEVGWFVSELSSEERNTWNELKRKNPSLADAYAETLAARLTATRIIRKARAATLRIERQINRTRNIPSVDTSSLLNELVSDRQRLELLRQEADVRLSEAKAQLQMIEAAANRTMDQRETDLMLSRLAIAQEQLPLALEMATMEQKVMSDAVSHRTID